MECNHSDQSFWIGKAGGVFCQVCGAKIDTKALSKKAEPEVKTPAKKTTAKDPEPEVKALSKKAEPAKDPEPEVKTPAKKAPAKKTTAKGGKK